MHIDNRVSTVIGKLCGALKEPVHARHMTKYHYKHLNTVHVKHTLSNRVFLDNQHKIIMQ